MGKPIRTALISDIHGNLIAFEAVLKDIEALQPDQIICLGDVANFGPQPREAIQRLMALGYPVVMGNTDEWMLNPGVPEHPEDKIARFYEALAFWCLEQLSPTELDYLRTFQPTLEVSLNSAAVFSWLAPELP